MHQASRKLILLYVQIIHMLIIRSYSIIIYGYSLTVKPTNRVFKAIFMLYILNDLITKYYSN